MTADMEYAPSSVYTGGVLAVCFLAECRGVMLHSTYSRQLLCACCGFSEGRVAPLKKKRLALPLVIVRHNLDVFSWEPILEKLIVCSPVV